MTLRRRLDRLEQRTPDPDARAPRCPVLWSEEEEVPADLPPGSRVVRVRWGPEPVTDTQTGESP